MSEECKHVGVTYRGIHEIGECEGSVTKEKLLVFLWTCDKCHEVIKKQVQWEWKK